jgi:DNA replication protein DnaC
MSIKKVIMAGVASGVGEAMRKAPEKALDLGIYLLGHRISVSNNNVRSYLKVNDWILSNLKSKVIKRKTKIDREWVNGEETYVKTLGLGKFTVYEKGTFYIIEHKKEEKKAYEEYQLNMNIIGSNADELHKEITDYSLKKCNDGKIGIRLGYEYKSVQKRDFDTIYCDDSIKESIISEIDRFNSQRPQYVKLGIPYKMGMLFHGKPGTGKTSMAKAIASYTDRDIQIVNLSNLKNLSEILRNVKEGDILLIEEIDTIVRNRSKELSKEEQLKRDKEEAENQRREDAGLLPEEIEEVDVENRENVQLGNLLNLIDGVATPENIIVIATTNHIETLDDALIREGRFDFKYEMEYLTKEKCEEVFDKHGFSKECLEELEYPLAPCKLQLEILKQLKNN